MSDPISSVYEFNDEDTPEVNPTAYKVQNELVEFGLTPNEAKVYIYLAKNGYKRAVEIAKAIHVPRTETYHLLSSLQNKGLVAATFQHPIKFSAVSFDKAIKILINIEKEQLRNFERKEKNLLALWSSIPDFNMYDHASEQEKFQILEGQVNVYSKTKDMRTRARQEVLVLGYEKDYMRLYHYDFMDTLDVLSDAGITVKLLATFSENSLHIFDGLKPETIRKIPENVNTPLCFVMIDRSELLFFINNNGGNNKSTLALWTDCKPFIEAMHILFSELWKNSSALEQAATKL